MNKKEEEKKDEKNLKKPEPFAFKNWTELIKPKNLFCQNLQYFNGF